MPYVGDGIGDPALPSPAQRHASCHGDAEGLAAVQFVQPFQLVVHRHQLVPYVVRIVDTGEIIQHGFDLYLAGDQDAALG